MTVGDEGAHSARLGERQRLTVVSLAALRVEPVGMGRDVAEQVQRMGRESELTWRGFDRAVAQTLRLVEPAKQQTGATQRVVDAARVAAALLGTRLSRGRLASQFTAREVYRNEWTGLAHAAASRPAPVMNRAAV